MSNNVLGAGICQFHIGDDLTRTKCWTMSANSQIKKAIEVVQNKLRKNNMMVKPSKKTAEDPFLDQSYSLEVDTTEVYNDDQVEFY